MVTENKNNLFKTLFRTIKQSLNGEQRDYTQGSIPQAVFLLAIPIGEALIALVAWYYFKKGKWKNIEV